MTNNSSFTNFTNALEPQLVALDCNDYLGLFIFGANADPNIYKLDEKLNKFSLFDKYPKSIIPYKHSICYHYYNKKHIIISCGGDKFHQHILFYNIHSKSPTTKNQKHS